MRGLVATVFAGMAVGCMAQSTCYRTAAAAVAAAATAADLGREDATGFRVEGVRHDAFSQARWALVRSCAHPEWPGQMIRVADAGRGLERTAEPAAARVVVAPILVLAGTRVRVVKLEASVRMELMGVAQANGREGEQLSVRLLVDGDREQFSVGMVRRDGSVEMDGR